MGIPFRSGDILASRTFVASSLGEPYTSVWHRRPDGTWTFYSDVSPESACTRYFGSDVERTARSPITIEWRGPETLFVEVPDAQLSCQLVLSQDLSVRAMNRVSAMFPEWAWRNPRMLAMTAAMAGPILRAGKLSLTGAASNGQWFTANPRKLWRVTSAQLADGDRVAAEIGAVTPQAQLGGFRIPQCGLVAIGNASFETFDPARHLSTTNRTGMGDGAE